MIQALLPPHGLGRARVDDRRVLDALFYILRTSAPWRDLPRRYGPYTTADDHFNRWPRHGVWGTVFNALTCEIPGSLQAVDSTIIQAHRAAAGAKGEQLQAIGRSRGGHLTKIHALADSQGRIRRALITAGPLHDGQNAHSLIAR
ncbi:IS5 family transposase [Roseomonas sp. GC11]|nr:IS5 family transposase [Roseomonas sp. GC11]